MYISSWIHYQVYFLIKLRFGYATLAKTLVEPVEVQGYEQKIKKPKMIIFLKKTPKFKDLMDKADLVKKENEGAFKVLYPEKK